MTDAAAAKHWLHGLCAGDRDGTHPLYGDWIHRPWVLEDAAGRAWTLAADRVRLVALRGRHGDAEDASPRALKALAPFLKPYPVCEECHGDGKYRPVPRREVLLCGVSADATLLAGALDAVGLAFGNVTDPDDLVEVCPARKAGLFREPDPEGPLVVRNVGEELWAVTLMPLMGDTAGDALADPATPRWPPDANGEG
jgi:hypothetical protein